MKITLTGSATSDSLLGHHRMAFAIVALLIVGVISGFPWRLVAQEANPARSLPSSTPGSRTFSLRHRLASEMEVDLRRILRGQPGQKATPAPDNVQLTVTAPPDVLNRVATFIIAQDWPVEIGPGLDGYKRGNVQDAARSFFYACSIEDIEGVARMLSPRLLAKLKGTNLTTFVEDGIDPRSGVTVVRQQTDHELVRMLRGNWAGKDAAVRKVVQAWNRFSLKQIRPESRFALGFGTRYFASAAFEGAPSDWVELGFIPEATGDQEGPPLMIDDLPPWFSGDGTATSNSPAYQPTGNPHRIGIGGIDTQAFQISPVQHAPTNNQFAKPASGANNPQIGAPMDAAKLRRLAWGPPATNGLRAACYFDPTKDTYADGEVVKSWQVFHNSGQEPLCFTVTRGGSPAEWIVVDEQDREVPLHRVYPYGKLVLETFRLEAGHAKEFECLSTGMGASTRAGGTADTAIQAKPGTTCRVRWVLSLAGTTRSDGKYVPTPGVWRGTLTTGEVRFRIVEKGAAAR